MKHFQIILLSLSPVFSFQNYNNNQEISLTEEELFNLMNSGTKIKFASEAHLKMTQLSNEAMRITSEMNSGYKNNTELRKLFSKLIKKEVDEGFGIFPPFFADCPQNIFLGKEVFINSGCKMQAQGGIYIGDKCLIGHNTVIATINHEINPKIRRDLIPKKVVIGNNVWIGSGSIILPGVSIGNNSIIGAGSVVNKNIPGNCIAVGNPAKVIKYITENDNK